MAKLAKLAFLVRKRILKQRVVIEWLKKAGAPLVSFSNRKGEAPTMDVFCKSTS